MLYGYNKQSHLTLIRVAVIMGIFYLLIIPSLSGNRFINHKDGTIADMQLQLMWSAQDNEYPISWIKAEEYCVHLKTGGYSNWRLPTLKELSSLYDKDRINTGGYHVAGSVETTASSCWANDSKGYLGGRFNFTHGEIHWLRKSYSGPTRVLAVRNMK